MFDYIVRTNDDWMEIIDNRTGEILVANHSITALELLEALGYSFELQDLEEE